MSTNEQVLERLDAIDRKLGYVVERQRWTEELVDEMAPIARLAMNAAIARLADWERRGAFGMLAELRKAMDHVLEHFSPEDARAFAESVVAILGTARNVTQPGVLDVANETTDVLHHTGEVTPVGMFGVVRKASSDEDIRRGLGVVLEVLRRVGRARSGHDAPPPAPRAAAAVAGGSSGASTPGPSVARADARGASIASPAPPSEDEAVHWEGHDFDRRGFLIDPRTWTPELAAKIAAGLGIELGDEHWAVIEWVRADYAETGASPNVRRTASGSGAGTETMYRLFPRTPGKLCAMISGVPKPVGCV